MRLFHKPLPNTGSIRVVRRFVFCRTIDNETRVFEFAWIKQRLIYSTYDGHEWEDVAWAEPPPKHPKRRPDWVRDRGNF